MIDVLAALSLANSAAKAEDIAVLLSDAELVYGIYKGGQKIDFAQLAADGKLKSLIEATARLSNVANTLAQDPTQLKNLTDLLGSI